MLYRIVRPIAAAGLRVFFRKIYLSHADRVPRGKPVILAANHPTAFIEPCVLACFMDRPLYFLVRGDLFVKGIYIFLLRNLHMLPVYRVDDRGYSFVKHNFSTFDACSDALRNNQTIMILAEGRTRHAKRLHTLQKGTGRLAFGALEKYPDLEEVFIVPVGVNFTYADRFRSQIMIDFEEPMRARDFWAQYQDNAGQGIADLTDELHRRLIRSVIHIDDPADDPLAEHLLVLERTETPRGTFPLVSDDPEPFRREKRIADLLNTMSEEEKEEMRRQTEPYFAMLHRHEVTDEAVFHGPARYTLLHTLLILAGLPLFAYGYLANLLPVKAAQWITRRTVRRIEFYSPVLWAAGMGAFLAYILLLLVVLPFWLGAAGWWWLVSVPLSGLFALFYRDFYLRWHAARRFRRLPAEVRRDLEDQRLGLRRELGKKLV